MNPEDILILEYADPDNPGHVIREPMAVPRDRQAQIFAENPDLGSVLRPTNLDELRGLADLQDRERRRAAIRESPIFGRLATFGINFANEMFMGAPSALMGEDEQRTLEAANEEFGGTAALGTAAGILAPAIATGGARLGQAGVAALVPGVAAQAAGNSVESLLMRQLVARGVSPATARALSIAGGATADGAMSGLEAAITQANISDTPLDAESILANVGIGAGLGLGTGGLMSARMGRRARRQAMDLAENGMGQAGVRVGEDGSLELVPLTNPEAQGLLAEVVTSRPVRALSGLTADGADRELRQLMVPGAINEAQASSLYTRQAQELSTSLDEVVNRAAREHIEPLRTASFRQRRFAELAGAEDVAEPLRNVMAGSARALDDLVEGAGQRLPVAARSRARQIAALVRGAGEASSAPELATALDNLLDRVRVDRLDEGVTDPDLRFLIEGAITKAERGLERLGPAGSAAVAAQRAVRDYDLAMRDLRANSLAKNNVSLNETRFNPGALFASVSDSGFRVKQDFSEDLARLNSQASMAARVAEEQYGVPSNGLTDELAAATGQLAELKRKGELIASYRNLTSGESRGAGLMAALGMSGVGAGTTIGGLAGGLPGALLGGAVGLAFAAATHPLSALQRLGFLGGAKRATQARLTEEVGGLRKMLESGRRFRRVQGASRAVPRLVLALRSQAERRKEYQEVTSQLRSLLSSPEALFETISEATGGVEEVGPGLASYMANTHVRAVHYLTANLPPVDAPSIFGHLQDLEPSQAEMDAFVRRFEALEDPLSIIRMASEFSLTVDHVQAVRSVYPELYGMIQAEITSMLGELTTLPPYSARMMVGTLLDVPTDPSLDSQFIHRMQQRYAQTGQQQQEAMPRQTTTGAKRLAMNTYSASQNREWRLSGGGSQ